MSDLNSKDRVRQKQIDQTYLYGQVRRQMPNGRVKVRWSAKAYSGMVGTPITPYTTSELPENLERI